MPERKPTRIVHFQVAPNTTNGLQLNADPAAAPSKSTHFLIFALDREGVLWHRSWVGARPMLNATAP